MVRTQASGNIMAAEKIPVGGTIAHAYSFTFGNILNNIGAIWIPFAVFWLMLYILPMVVPDGALIEGARAGSVSVGLSFSLSLLFMLFFWLIASAQTAGLSKEAFGLRRGNAFLQFPFGAAAWRILGNVVVYLLVMFVIYLALSILIYLIAKLFGIAGTDVDAMSTGARVMRAILGLAFLCALIYVSTRLWFFIAPVSVAQHQVSLIKTWELSKGNFWRIFAILFVLFIPFLIVDGILFYKIFGPIFDAVQEGVTADDMAGPAQEAANNIRYLVENWWFLGYPLAFAHTLLTTAFYSGASAYAFRAVTRSDNAAEVF
jgi:hypothetical protein